MKESHDESLVEMIINFKFIYDYFPKNRVFNQKLKNIIIIKYNKRVISIVSKILNAVSNAVELIIFLSNLFRRVHKIHLNIISIMFLIIVEFINRMLTIFLLVVLI